MVKKIEKGLLFGLIVTPFFFLMVSVDYVKASDKNVSYLSEDRNGSDVAPHATTDEHNAVRDPNHDANDSDIDDTSNNIGHGAAPTSGRGSNDGGGDVVSVLAPVAGILLRNRDKLATLKASRQRLQEIAHPYLSFKTTNEILYILLVFVTFILVVAMIVVLPGYYNQLRVTTKLYGIFSVLALLIIVFFGSTFYFSSMVKAQVSSEAISHLNSGVALQYVEAQSNTLAWIILVAILLTVALLGVVIYKGILKPLYHAEAMLKDIGTVSNNEQCAKNVSEDVAAVITEVAETISTINHSIGMTTDDVVQQELPSKGIGNIENNTEEDVSKNI